MREKSSVFISTYALFDRPLNEAIEELIQDEWASIEIMCEGQHSELLAWPDGKLNELRARAEDKGISWSVHAPIAGCNPAAQAGPIREQSLETMKRCLDAAMRLDSTHVVLHAGEIGDRLNQEDRVRGVEQVLSFLEPLVAQQIRGARTILALENVPPYPCVLGWEVADLIDICKRTADPQTGIVYDVGHAHLIREGYAVEALRQVLPYLQALHLSDNLGVNDDHLAVGRGTVPFAPILALLEESGFAGSWVVETKSLADAHESIEHLRQRYGAQVRER